MKNIMIVKNFLFFITFVIFFSFGCIQKNLSFKDQMIEIDRIYKTNVSNRLLIHMQTYSETWPEINKVYKNISIQVLESEAAEIINDSSIWILLLYCNYDTINAFPKKVL